jgi:hypothetical protein
VPHEADRGFGDAREAPIAVLQIVDRTRNHVADADRLAGLRIGDQAIVREGVLAVEYAGQRVRGAGKRGSTADVAGKRARLSALAGHGSGRSLLMR